ncbi:MAG: hypothetical protein V3V03_08025 [Hyphomonadaceae bacterium]
MRLSAFALASLIFASPMVFAQEPDEAESPEDQAVIPAPSADPSCFVTASGKTVRILGVRSMQRLTRIEPESNGWMDPAENAPECTKLADFHSGSQLRVFRGGQIGGLKTLDLSQMRRLQTRHISTANSTGVIIIAGSRLQE